MRIEYNDNIHAYVAGQMVGDKVIIGTGWTVTEAVYHCLKRIVLK